MDQAFFLRAQRLLARRPAARLDFESLSARVAGQQAATPTARAQASLSGTAPDSSSAGLATLILGQGGWPEAASARAGRFGRSETARGVKDA